MQAPPVAVPAATVLVLRDSPVGAQVLLMRRPASMSFGGYWVFPGGKVNEADRRYAAWLRAEEADPRDAGDDLFAVPAPPEPLAALLAAVRETFEETGLLFVRTLNPTFAERYERFVADWRVAVHRDPSALEALLVAERARPHWEALAFWTRWLPPGDLAQRFDTDFFLARAPAGQRAVPDPGEADELRWLTVAGADWEPLKTAPVTRFMLLQLRARLPAAGSVEALVAAVRAAPMPPLVPLRLVEAGVRYAVLPWDPAYRSLEGADERPWSAAEQAAMAGLPSRLVIPDDLVRPPPSAD